MKKKTILFFVLFLGSLSVFLPRVYAETVDEIEAKQANEQANMEVLQGEIDTALAEINQIHGEIDALNQSIANKEIEIGEASESIASKEEKVAKLTELAGERMREIQMNMYKNDPVMFLFESESISDLFNRMNILNTIQGADKQLIADTKAAKDELEDTKTFLVTEKDQLSTEKITLSEKSIEVNGKITNLQASLDQNASTLAALETAKNTEIARIDEEKQAAIALAEAEDAKKKEAAASSSVAAESSVSVNNSSESTPTVAEPEKPTNPDTGSGNVTTLTVIATAYSYQQEGLSYFTATGIDLRQNPMVIAVDPSVIPLMKSVSVPGYGTAIAGDTGGGIIGNHIDVHFPTVAEAHAWGTKLVTIEILN